MATSSRSLLMASLYKKTKQSQLVVTHNLYQAQKVYEDLVALLGEKDVWLYPVNESDSIGSWCCKSRIEGTAY